MPGGSVYLPLNKGREGYLFKQLSKELAMKKIAYLMLVAMLSLTLAACASHKGMGGTKVKCPACGYEFAVPDNATGTDSN